MPTDDGDLERLERECREADRRYNDALTAFDAALIHLPPIPGAPAIDDAPLPEWPGGWRGWLLAPVREWLAPRALRQQAVNARTAAAFEALMAREGERAAGFERFQSALIVLLQQVTAFVETKDRRDAGVAWREFVGHQRQLEELKQKLQQKLVDDLPDLHSQVAVLQRTTHMLTRERESSPPVASAGAREIAGPPANPAAAGAPADDYKYVGFEDQFRGSVEEIAARLADYLPIFAGASDVLDVGCGRGEFLALLQAAGVSARGVDVNGEMVATARERGLEADRGDALAHLAALPDASLGGLFCAQVVEHLEPAYLMRFLQTAFGKLRPGAPLVVETINPVCWAAFFSSYLRDFTHVRAIHPETLAYLARASGFSRVSIRYSAPVSEDARMHLLDVTAALQTSSDPTATWLVGAARILNRNAEILNNNAFSFQDYAVVGYRS